MAIIPSGAPLWSGSASATVYGGHPNKRDYGGIGSVNYLTDISAAQFSRMVEDMAALSSVAALLRITIQAAAGSTFNVLAHSSAWGTRSTTSYPGATPPSGFPAAVNIGSGSYLLQLTLPATATDAFGQSAAILPRFAFSPGCTAVAVPTSNIIEFTWPGAIDSIATIVVYR